MGEDEKVIEQPQGQTPTETQPAQPEVPKGRQSFLSAYKEANPEASEDPDDDGLMDFAHEKYSEMEEKYKGLSGSNEKLAALVAKDPKLGAVLSMLVGDEPKSLPYAIGSVYGKEPFADIEDFETGYQEQLARLAASKEEQEKANKNIQEYEATMTKFGEDNGLSEQQLMEVHAGLEQFANNLLMGIIPVELIELVYKGMNYDKDVEEAAATGEVEGRNAQIEAKMKEATGTPAVPDMGSTTGAGATKPKPTPKRSFYDSLEDEK